MTPISTVVTAIAALSGAAVAMVCTSSETYCGSRLLSLGTFETSPWDAPFFD